jgi:hypothetical protein
MTHPRDACEQPVTADELPVTLEVANHAFGVTLVRSL